MGCYVGDLAGVDVGGEFVSGFSIRLVGCGKGGKGGGVVGLLGCRMQKLAPRVSPGVAARGASFLTLRLILLSGFCVGRRLMRVMELILRYGWER